MPETVNKLFLLKTSSGTLWGFWLSPEEKIVYCQLDPQIEHQSHSLSLDLQHVKEFSATIDLNSYIHILAFTSTNQLVYLFWDGLKWQRQTVEYLKATTQYMPYFSIMAYQNTIHLLYYIKSFHKSGTDLLVHYHWNGNKWIKQKSWSFSANSLTNIESTFIDNSGNLHLLFSQYSHHEHVLLYSCFSPTFSSWSTPVAIHKLNQECSDFFIYADSYHRIHIIWKEKDNANSSIKYLLAKGGLQPGKDIQEPKIIYSGQDEPVFPVLLCIKDLYCQWVMDSCIHHTISQDGGNTWISHAALSNRSNNLTLYYYTTFDRPDFPPTLCLWGTDYKDVLNYTGLVKSPERISVQNDSPENKKDQQMLYAKLEKRIASIEQQVENMASTIYSIQDQLLQNSRSMYYMEAMIKKLNFQVEQLRTSTKYPLYNTDAVNKEKKPAPLHEQASQSLTITQPSENTSANHTTYPSSSNVNSDGDTTNTSQNRLAKTQFNSAAQPLDKTPSDSKAREGDQPEEMTQSHTSPQRISLGNVDIIVNPQE